MSSFVFSLLLLVVFILRAFLSLRKPDICRRLEELKKEKFGESYDDFSDQDQVCGGVCVCMCVYVCVWGCGWVGVGMYMHIA